LEKGDSLPEYARKIVHSAGQKLAISIEMTTLDAICHTFGLDKISTSNWASNVVKSMLGFLESVDNAFLLNSQRYSRVHRIRQRWHALLAAKPLRY
jgi:hypothetical protein